MTDRVPTDLPDLLLQEEWEDIRRRRAAVRDLEGAARDSRPSPEVLRDVTRSAPDGGGDLHAATDASLIGLAFSGGGIRSATFNLGLLQSLERSGILDLVDYVSTVSGGGYLGSSLSAMKHAPGAPRRPYTEGDGDSEPPLLSHLRNHSNYMAPGGAQGWSALVVNLVRGLFLTTIGWLPWPLLAAIVIAVMFGHHILLEVHGSIPLSDAFRATPFALLAVVGVFAASPLLLLAASPREPAGPGEADDTLLRRRAGIERMLVVAVVVALVIALAESQILFVAWFHEAFDLKVAGLREAYAACGGALAVVAAFGARLLSDAEPKLLKLAGVALAILAVLATPFIVYLYAVDLIVFTGDLDGNLVQRVQGLPSVVWAIFGFSILATLIVDVNDSALHGVYRDRLSQAYVLQPGDGGVPVSADNLPLTGLCREGSTAPYHLVNTALNLGAVKDLSLRGRKSDFFVFSKRWTGSAYTGWARTEAVQTVAPRIDLASAMAISAAAASPNMGSFTNPLLAPIMVLLNVRLGVWTPNPKRLGDAPSGDLVTRWLHRPGPARLLDEMATNLHADGRLVNLSDGGHIENLGVFELLRRRCRYIIAGDGEADPDLALNGLATVMRYARIELGVQIDLDTGDLSLDDAKNARRHAIVGKITYPRTATRAEETGYLLYVKLSVTGDEDTLINEYRHRYPDFPHQSTGDQFFDEAQFEAYRSLGEHVGVELLQTGGLGEDATFADLEAYFERLHVSLTPAAAGSASPSGLPADVVLPEVDSPLLQRWLEVPAPGVPADVSDDDKVQVLKETAYKLTAMEAEFRALDLGRPGAADHPDASGVLAGFRRRADAPSFRWAATYLLPMHGEPFQRFARETLGLGGSIHWIPAGPDDIVDEGLADEDELETPVPPGSIAQAFLGLLKPPEGDDGLPVIWMRISANRDTRSVGRLGAGMHPGFTSRLRFREALLEGNDAIRAWLAKRVGPQDAAATTVAHAFAGGEDTPPTPEQLAAVDGWDFPDVSVD